MRIQQGTHFLYLVPGRCGIVYVLHNSRIVFLPSERNNHPAANLYNPRHILRQRVCKAGMQGKGQYDIYELFHCNGKDNVKKTALPIKIGNAIQR